MHGLCTRHDNHQNQGDLFTTSCEIARKMHRWIDQLQYVHSCLHEIVKPPLRVVHLRRLGSGSLADCCKWLWVYTIRYLHCVVVLCFVVVVPSINRFLYFVYPYPSGSLSPGLGQSYNCPIPSDVTLKDMSKIGWYLTTTKYNKAWVMHDLRLYCTQSHCADWSCFCMEHIDLKF